MTGMHRFSRRGFFGTLIPTACAVAGDAGSKAVDLPVVDYHVHLNPSFTLEKAVAFGKSSGIKLGIAEHAGTKENRYANILTNDKELQGWIGKLANQPVYKGIQAEWIDWTGCFSKDVVAQMDYVLSDAMTMPGPDGQRVRMWSRTFQPGDAQDFMNRYVKWNVQVIETEPLDIFAHPTWLPPPLDKDFDVLWTEARMKPIIAALKHTGTAVEIDSAYKIPHMPFLNMAKAAGLKFSFGSNSGSGPERAIEFCVETAKRLALKRSDLFVPAPRARKPIMRRKITG
jgi:histidinol phosphatase-like PHP family hydrolase